MELLVQIIHVLVATFMIVVVLIQGGNQGGIGAAFGGGNTQGFFGATGATTFLGKLTYAAGLIFVFTSITLTIMQGGGSKVGLNEKLKAASQERATMQAEPAAEAESKPAESPAK